MMENIEMLINLHNRLAVNNERGEQSFNKFLL